MAAASGQCARQSLVTGAQQAPDVLEPDAEVALRVGGHRVARVSVDGRDSGVADAGDAVVCTAAQDSARLVTFGHRDFHRVLRAKFGLADR